MPTQTNEPETNSVPPPSVTYLGGSAGFRSTVGMYKIAENGLIYDVTLLFADASAGEGALIAGESSVDLDVSSGDHIGFFMLPDSFTLNEDPSVFSADRYELRDWGGSLGNIYEDTALRLYAIDETTNEETLVEARWNDATWHMHHNIDAGIGLNSDGVDHVRGLREYDNSITIGFSDTYGNSAGSHESILLNVNLGDSGAYIEDDDIASDADQTEHNWIAPVEIAEDLPEVPLAVRSVSQPPEYNVESDLGGTQETAPATVTFMGESAGYRNTFGVYKIDDIGMIYDVQIVFANASNQGSGGNLIAGESTVEIDAGPGDNLGFFILSDGWGQNWDKSVFDADSYVFRDWGGGEGNVYWSTGLRLFAVDEDTGQETLVNARFNAATWHMHHKPEDGIDMNVDYFDHLRGQLKYDGSITVGFEDIRGGGDRDFNDVMFNINLGDSGATIDDENILSGADQHEHGFVTDDGEAAQAKVTFLSETADYKNTIGMYKIAEDGTISDVSLLFANASKYDSGGELISGESSVDIDVDLNDQLGFFILPDGYARNSDKSLFDDGTFVLRNADGEIGNVLRDQDLSLYRVDEESGEEVLLRARYGNTTFHMSHDDERGISMNSDGLDHSLGEMRDGNKVILGFEDIRNNGDWDFDDVVIQVELSSTGAVVAEQNLKSPDDTTQSDVGWIFTENDDVFDNQPWPGENDRIYNDGDAPNLDALSGDDLIYGDESANTLYGNSGHDVLLGHGGDDQMLGGGGRDHLNGGLGNDQMSGEAGRDLLWGQHGDDTLDGGAGADKLWGGAGADVIQGGSGDDRLYGNLGEDVLQGGGGEDWLFGGEGSDTFVFDFSDIDGSVDTIGDLTLAGAEQDTIDLQLLNLLSEGETKADWITANASQNEADVELDLGGGTLVLQNVGSLETASYHLEQVLIC
ncbi:DUF4114 domain-containing protein [Cognatishimia sp. D5M38]|uniref:DUF4114 domain-containing protein n=1 Tax=Cognatishimia coralii TaxID=3083254 RepID=A0ABU8QIR3_9RHOB